MLVGLCGAAGSGKSTIADALRTRHGFKVVSFADPLYEAVSLITGVDVCRLKDRAFKESPLPGIGKSPRHLLQTLGTEWGRQMVSPDIWVSAAMARVESYGTVIADVRFDNEADAIRSRGGKVLYVVRPGWRCLGEGEARHSSEQGVSLEKINGVIDNSGTVDSLLEQVEKHIL